MTDLLLYYLFQPFTTTVNVKSGAYMIFSVVKWIFYSMVFWIPCRSDILAVILIASHVLGYTGVILAQAISDALTAALAVLLMRRYKP